PAIPWREKIMWVLLAAAPSSLMLSVTTHLTTDVASAPLLWVIPLALYLLTFVLAFGRRVRIPMKSTLLLQAAFVAVLAGLTPFQFGEWVYQFFVHMTAF